MFKFICLALCAMAIGLDRVNGEPSGEFHDAMKPMIDECLEKEGVTKDDIHKAKEAQSIDGIKPCFISCVFKKAEIINSKGDYDVDTNIAKLKKWVKNEDHLSKLSEVAKKCGAVNDEAVSDGEAGCERAVLVAKCFMDHKSELPM